MRNCERHKDRQQFARERTDKGERLQECVQHSSVAEIIAVEWPTHEELAEREKMIDSRKLILERKLKHLHEEEGRMSHEV